MERIQFTFLTIGIRCVPIVNLPKRRNKILFPFRQILDILNKYYVSNNGIYIVPAKGKTIFHDLIVNIIFL